MSWLEGAVKKRAKLKKQGKEGFLKKKATIAKDLGNLNEIYSVEISDPLEDLEVIKDKFLNEGGTEEDFLKTPEGHEWKVLYEIDEKGREKFSNWDTEDMRMIKSDYLTEYAGEYLLEFGFRDSPFGKFEEYINLEDIARYFKDHWDYIDIQDFNGSTLRYYGRED